MAELTDGFAGRQLAATIDTSAGPQKLVLHTSQPPGELMVMLDRLVARTNIPPDACRFVLPPDLLPGLTHVYGIAIIRGEISEPLVAVTLPH
jgi:hypothetical protein